MSARSRAATPFRLLIAISLTGLVLWQSDPAAVWQAVIRADLAPIGIACLLVVADRALMAYRWVVLLRPIDQGRRPAFGALMQIFFVSTFVGTFLPASVGGDAVRAYSLARHDVAGTAAVASVFMDRMLGVLSILVMAAGALFLARDLATDAGVLAGLLVAAIACGATGLVVFNEWAAEHARALIARVPMAPLQRVARGLIEAIQGYAPYRRQLMNVLACSVAVQALRIVQGFYLGRALGIDAPLTLYFAFVPLILLIMLLPITVNGIGTSQAGFVWFFARAGVSRPDAFALSVLFVALGIVGNLPGGFLYVVKGVHAPTTRPFSA